MSLVEIKSREKEYHKPEILEFKGEDAFYQLYKYLAEKYGFNGEDHNGSEHEKISQNFRRDDHK